MDFRSDYKITRREAGVYLNGVYTPGASVTLTIRASVQPASGKDFHSLPEGRKVKQAFNVFTDSRLYTSDELAHTEADQITINGQIFEIISVAPYQSGLLPHYKGVAVL